MMGTSASGRFGRPARPADGSLGDRSSSIARSPRQLLDRFPISISGRAIHVRVGGRRIPPEDSLDAADRLDERRPVERRQHAHGVDDVGDRQLVDRFALLLDSQHFIGRLTARIRVVSAAIATRRSTRPTGPAGCAESPRETWTTPLRRPAAVLRLSRPCSRACGERPCRFPLLSAREGSVPARPQRFSTSASRNMMGIAQSSPIVSGVTSWYASANRRSDLLVEPAGGVGDEISCEYVNSRVTAPASPRSASGVPGSTCAEDFAGFRSAVHERRSGCPAATLRRASQPARVNPSSESFL